MFNVQCDFSGNKSTLYEKERTQMRKICLIICDIRKNRPFIEHVDKGWYIAVIHNVLWEGVMAER
jgi:hypothetical protein